jgi:ankyrin repeat protein
VTSKRAVYLIVVGLVLAVIAALLWRNHMELGATVNAGQVELTAAEEFPDAKSNDLVRAVGRGDVGAIERSARDGANLNAVGAVRRVSPLMWGVLAGKLESASALLRLGANPNYVIKLPQGMSGWEEERPGKRDRRNSLVGDSAISLAVFRQDMAALRLLLDGGADPNDTGAFPPALFSASAELKKNEVNPILLLMLKHGGNVNLKDRQGEPFLKYLITTGKMRTAMYVIEKGADLHALDTKTTIPWSEDYYAMLKTGKAKEQPDDYYRYNYAAYQLFRITGRDGKRGDETSRQMRQMLVDRGVKMETWDPINVGRRRKEAGLWVLREEGVPDGVINTIIRMNKTYEATLTPEYQELIQLGRFLEKEYLNEKK